MDQCNKQLLDQMSVVLKRQRGDAYNFGDNPDSEELVTKQLPKADLEKAPTHTKDIENLFGIQDSRFPINLQMVSSLSIPKTCLEIILSGILQR